MSVTLPRGTATDLFVPWQDDPPAAGAAVTVSVFANVADTTPAKVWTAPQVSWDTTGITVDVTTADYADLPADAYLLELQLEEGGLLTRPMPPTILYIGTAARASTVGAAYFRGPAGAGSSITATDTPATPAEGTAASYLVTSSVTWPSGLQWSTDPDNGTEPVITGTALVSLFTLDGITRAVMGSTYPATTDPDPDPDPDTTPPTAGTLAASSITDTGFTLTVSGASDETALDAAPYAFSTDNGASYSAWQAAATYNATGLTASTAYDCVHKVRDAAANVATGTAITVTTGAGSGSSLESAILALSPIGYWKLDETTGTTAADSSGNGRNGTYGGTGYALAGQDGAVILTADSYIEIPDADAFTAGASGFSTFAIGRPTSLAAAHYFVSKAGASQYEWGMSLTSAAVWGRYWNLAATEQREITSTETPTLNAWNAYTWTAGAPSSSATMALYKGATALTGSAAGAVTYSNGTAPVRIGLRASGTGGFVGAVQHVAVFAAKLTAGQVAGLVSAAQSDGILP